MCGAINFSSILCIIYWRLEDVQPTMHFPTSYIASLFLLVVILFQCATRGAHFLHLVPFAFLIRHGNSNAGVQLGIPFFNQSTQS